MMHDPMIGGGVMIVPPLISLIAGILILVYPQILNYVVATYLILFGLVGLTAQLSFMGWF